MKGPCNVEELAGQISADAKAVIHPTLGGRIVRFLSLVVLDVLAWAGPRLTRIGLIRKPLARLVEKHVKASSGDHARSGRKPPRVVEDRMQTGVTILRTVERALAENRLSNASIRRILKNFGHDTMLKKGHPSIREEFIKTHGVRPPEILLISPTKGCNLSCKGCYADSASLHIKLPWPVLDRLVTEVHDIWGGRFIVFSGGEPLVYRDGGHGILDLAEKHRDCYFMMYTNGTLIDDAMARRMADLGNLIPAISIEGLKESTDARRGDGVFDKICAAMERLRRAKVFYGASITATRSNVDEIFSDRVIDFYFKEMGALFGWVFQYMPIGRAITLDMMPTPEQRLFMWQRSWELINKRRLFIADFWNGGTAAQGCIGAGRSGGYMAVIWNGDVVPCVFMPYSPINAVTAYAEGKNLIDIWSAPFFKQIRDWQYSYGYGKDYGADPMIGNWMMPCPARDHYAESHPWLEKFHVKPIDENAEAAMKDPDYYAGMVEYNKAVASLLNPIWEKEYLDPDFKLSK